MADTYSDPVPQKQTSSAVRHFRRLEFTFVTCGLFREYAVHSFPVLHVFSSFPGLFEKFPASPISISIAQESLL